MKSNILVWTFLAITILFPILTFCQNARQNSRNNLSNGLIDDTIEVFSPRPRKPVRKFTTMMKMLPGPVCVPRIGLRVITCAKSFNYDENASNEIEKFSLDLLSTFRSRLSRENFMISPFSIYHLLAIIAEGSRGDTFEELKQKMGFRSLENIRNFQQYLNAILKKNTDDVVLKKFSMLISDENRPVKFEFEQIVENLYESDIEPVNFSEVDKTLNLINKRISDLTEGQIKDALKRDNLLRAQLILISGLFFKGNWMNVFNSTLTNKEAFYDESGKRIGFVNMMFQEGPLPYAAVVEIGCHVLELPYGKNTQISLRTNEGKFGSGLSMIAVLPRKGLSLEDSLKNVKKHGMKKIYEELDYAKTEYGDEAVQVYLPRFEIESSLDLKAALNDFGINKIFDESADLSKINPNYFVSSMNHKTKISVDEKGSTASAVSNAVVVDKISPPTFGANRPFLFFIVDKFTNLILFSGQYAVPELY